LINNKRLRGCNPFTDMSNTTCAHASKLLSVSRQPRLSVNPSVCSFETFRKTIGSFLLFYKSSECKGKTFPSHFHVFMTILWTHRSYFWFYTLVLFGSFVFLSISILAVTLLVSFRVYPANQVPGSVILSPIQSSLQFKVMCSYVGHRHI